VTFELARGLLLTGKVSPEKLAEALYAVVTQGVPLARALVGLGAIDERELESELAKDSPNPLKNVVPSSDLMDRLPPGLCHRLGAAPISADAAGTVQVAVLDPHEPHAADEIAYHLRCAVQTRRASYAALREALEGYPAGLRALAPPMGADVSRGHTPIWGTPAPIRRKAVPKRSPSRTYAMANIGAERLSSVDSDGVRFTTTRSWDNGELGENHQGEDSSWDAEPVFELRRLGPPQTVPDPEPITVRLSPEEAAIPPPRRKSKPPPLPAPLPPAPLVPRIPVAPNAPSPPFVDLGSTLANIRIATDRDAVLGLILLGTRTVARRVATLIVRKDSLEGWSCTPEFGDEAALKELKIPLRAPNLLTAVLAGGVHLGPLMGTVAAPLLRIMRTASQDVAIAALRVGDRAAVLIVADELGDTLLGTKRIDELARAGGDALLRILRTKRE
jgi:hypothetical protein